ncbi:MAG: LytTR family DNA-binding domain-containing protein [Hespellia sp.]|nr:LytTR family DNA-binding domain-containing protein [Hespellia sp.]
MRIGICDDNIKWCCRVETILNEFTKIHNINAQTQCFFSGEELLLLEGEPQILFLDIKLKGKDGITIAKSVNELWPHCQIVFMTNYLNYATEVYRTEHVYFVLKEQFQQKLPLVMERVLHIFGQTEKNLIFSVIGGNEVILSPDEIVCIERNGRESVIETIRGTYRIWDKIPEIARKLPSIDFVRCHNSCIVYFPAVGQMLKDRFVMKNGKEVLISRAYGKVTREAFLNWAKTQTI